MKVCFPVPEDKGMDSRVYGHFGSAPMFVLVDTELGQAKALNNIDRRHKHGGCRPLRALGGEQVDAIVVGGIGAGALQGLKGAGFKVYQAQGATVADNISSLKQSQLTELSSEQVCGGHAHGHGHGHGCSH